MALPSFDTTLYITGVAVVEVTNLAVGGSSLAEIDITSLTATDKSYVMGSLEAGTMTIDFFAPANWASIDAALVPASGDSQASSFQLAFNGGSLTASFNGICTNLSITAEQDGAVTASATVKLTTAITWS